MSTERWVAGTGQGLTWGNITFQPAATNRLNSLPNGDSVINDTDIANATPLDIFADLSVSLGSITTVAPNYLGVFLYPLNQDGTTYGDAAVANDTQNAVTPSATYWVGNIIVPVGTQVCVGQIDRIILPPGTFRFVLFNQLGAALAASANTVKYRTYNRQVS